MKKIFVALMLISFFAFSQDTPQLEGIGKFKINKTTISIVNDLSKELRVSLKKINSSQQEFDEDRNDDHYIGNYILELIRDTINQYESPAYSSNCPNVKVFKIRSYEIAGIKIEKIYLHFYNDILIEFECENNDQLREAMRLKYGKSKLDFKEKEIKCTYTSNGNQITYKEISSTESWYNSDTTVTGTCLLNVYYSEKCEKSTINILSISNYKFSKTIYDCDKANREATEARKNAQKKSKLSEF